MVVDNRADFEQRLAPIVSDCLGSDAEWTVTETTTGCRLGVSDRTLDISSHDGPDGSTRWVLSLEADESLVGKFGPYDSLEGLTAQVRTVLTSTVFYTVCCDGDR